MGVDNRLEVTYKKGLLKTLFEEEGRKQYLESAIENEYQSASRFVRKIEDDDEYEKVYWFAIEITNHSHPKRSLRDWTDTIHYFKYIPEKRKLIVSGLGRYNWGNESEYDKKVISYYENLLKRICPPDPDVYYRHDWSVYMRSDLSDPEIDEYGDELDDQEVANEIPESLRTLEEQSQVITRFGSADNADNECTLTIEDAVYRGNDAELSDLLKTHGDSSEQRQLLYASCHLRHTNCVDVLVRAGVTPDNKALSISIKNLDDKTAQCLLNGNTKLVPCKDDLAAAVSDRDLFDMLLEFYGRRFQKG